ncbi:hypothetical protein ACFL7E_08030, partial [Thermodesulfobacteriota bacterium]
SYKVKVARADSEPGEENKLYEYLEAAISPEAKPWSDFSKEVEKAVKDRRCNLKGVIRRVE